MTTKQFLKKYVPKEQRLDAEEFLDQICMYAEERGFVDGNKQAAWSLRGLANEILSW